MEFPYISVVIPVLNGVRFIDACLESVINLEYPKDNFEVIIVDNGSTDGTTKFIRSFQSKNPQIKLYFEKMKSSYAARNLGVTKAKGQIIAFTDVDCIVDRNWLNNLVGGFSESFVGSVAGRIVSQNGASLVEKYSSKIDILSQEHTLNSDFLPYPQTANVAYRKKIFDQIGYFDYKLISGGDADFAWRVQLETNHKILYVANAIVIHRHRTNLKGLFKQQFKYGYGIEILYEKYKKYDRSGKKQISTKVLMINYKIKIINSIKQIILCFDFFHSKKADEMLLFEPIISLISFSGYRLGNIYGLISIKLNLLRNAIISN